MFRSPLQHLAQRSRQRRLADSNRCINPLTIEQQRQTAQPNDFVTATRADLVTTHAAQPPREAATPIKETDLSAYSPSPSQPWLWPPQPGLPPSLNYTSAQIGNNE